MLATQRTSEQQKHFRTAAAMLLAAALSLVTAFLSALALLPRVRHVEVVTVVATAVAAGAALAAALVEFKQARTNRQGR
jgi:type II secretory pathway component PulF